MKQYPSRLKYKKNHKPPIFFKKLKEQKNFFAKFGTLVIKAIESGILNYAQIEACRKSIKRALRRKKGAVHIRVFTNYSISKKPVASRMGKGKGNHSVWVSTIRSGQVICEASGGSAVLLKRALKSAKTKLPFKTKVEENKY